MMDIAFKNTYIEKIFKSERKEQDLWKSRNSVNGTPRRNGAFKNMKEMALLCCRRTVYTGQSKLSRFVTDLLT